MVLTFYWLQHDNNALANKLQSLIGYLDPTYTIKTEMTHYKMNKVTTCCFMHCSVLLEFPIIKKASRYITALCRSIEELKRGQPCKTNNNLTHIFFYKPNAINANLLIKIICFLCVIFKITH